MFLDENEYVYEITNNDYDYDYTKNTLNQNKYNTYEGPNYIYNFRDKKEKDEYNFLRGNMFDNIYDGYFKNIKRININNERERLLFTIQKLSFNSLDLTLYLDIHPEDTKETMNLKNINKELKNYIDKYESIYGPLCSYDDMNGNNFEWSKNPWPFSKGGNY